MNVPAKQTRRHVHYDSIDDILEDAERLAKLRTRTIGNWSVGQIFKHLAMASDVMIDGAPVAAPRPIQWFLRMFLKKRFTTHPLPSGFQLKGKAKLLIPDETSTEQGLLLLRKAINRVANSHARAPHPAFGKCSREDWDAFHCRHAELHMSYIICED